MPVVTMPDGVNVSFPDEMPRDQIKAMIAQKFPDAVKALSAPARPQGFLANAAEPITSYPGTYAEMNHEARDRAVAGFGQASDAIKQPVDMEDPKAKGQNTVDFVKGVGNMAAGAAGYIGAPISAAYRTMVGRPVEATTGIPKEYTELAAQLATPGLGFARMPTRIPGPMNVPAGAKPVGAPLAEGRAPTGQEVADAGQSIGVDLPRAVTSDMMGVQQMGKIAAAAPIAGTPLRTAAETAINDLGQAAQTAREGYGAGNQAVAGSALQEGIRGSLSSGPIKQRVTDLYNRVDSLVDPAMAGPLPNTSNLVGSIAARRQNAALPPSEVAAQLKPALARDGLNYQGVKDLRTHFGEMRDGNVPIPQGMSDTEVKQVYEALSKDMRIIIARAGGPAGLRAFDQANRAAAEWAPMREELANLLKVKNEEGIFSKVASMAGSRASADIDMLRKVRVAVGPEKWDEFSSAVISKMGWRPGGTDFSPDAFLTAYKSMSPEGRQVVFRSTGNQSHADAIDAIATISERFKRLNKFANPSGTGQTVAGLSELGGIAPIVAGHFAEPLTMISTMVGTRILSHILARPAASRAMANWSRDYEAAVLKPTPKALDAFDTTSRLFAGTIGRDFSRPDLVNNLVRQLQTSIPTRAEPDKQD